MFSTRKKNIEKLIEEMQQLFEDRGVTLALAESCTGGALSAAIASRPGISKFYRGAVVSYSAEVKQKILGVPRSLLQALGEVSEPVARAMAQGVRKELGSHWSAAITGIAGPTGGSREKPVGMVCFAVVGPGFEQVETKLWGSLKRSEIQSRSVEHALRLLVDALQH